MGRRSHQFTVDSFRFAANVHWPERKLENVPSVLIMDVPRFLHYGPTAIKGAPPPPSATTIVMIPDSSILQTRVLENLTSQSAT